MIEITNCQLATKGKVIENVNVPHKFWELRFAIKPWASRAGWGSLVHGTAVGNKDIIGARIPGVFFRPGTTILHICGPYIYPYTAGCIDLNDSPLPLNAWRTLIIRQIPGFTENRFEISFRDIILGKNTPSNAPKQQSFSYPEILKVSHRFKNYLTTFQDVTVYEANPWLPQPLYQLSDYHFTSGMTDFNRFEEIKNLYTLWRIRLNVFLSRINWQPSQILSMLDMTIWNWTSWLIVTRYRCVFVSTNNNIVI